jgi:hypothetical protein
MKLAPRVVPIAAAEQYDEEHEHAQDVAEDEADARADAEDARQYEDER